MVFHRGDIVKKNIVKNVRFRKKTKGGTGHIGDVAHRRGRGGDAILLHTIKMYFPTF